MIELLTTEYVCVAINCSNYQVQQDKAGEFFRLIAEQGHYAGVTKPSATRQGLYAATPDGKLLSSVNSHSARHAMSTMFQGVRQWKAGWKDETYKLVPESIERDKFRNLKPDDETLILRETIRDLPRKNQKPLDSWRHNFDHFWLSRSEAESLIPNEIKQGATKNVDAEIVRRLTEFHLVDHVRGEATPWYPADVLERELSSKIVNVSESAVTIKLSGLAKFEQEPSGRLNPYSNQRITKKRGVDLRIYGRANFDRKSKKFTELNIVAIGDRWGTDVYNFRHNDMERAAIGFAFEVVENNATNHTPPAFATWNIYSQKN